MEKVPDKEFGPKRCLVSVHSIEVWCHWGLRGQGQAVSICCSRGEGRVLTLLLHVCHPSPKSHLRCWSCLKYDNYNSGALLSGRMTWEQGRARAGSALFVNGSLSICPGRENPDSFWRLFVVVSVCCGVHLYSKRHKPGKCKEKKFQAHERPEGTSSFIILRNKKSLQEHWYWGKTVRLQMTMDSLASSQSLFMQNVHIKN